MLRRFGLGRSEVTDRPLAWAAARDERYRCDADARDEKRLALARGLQHAGKATVRGDPNPSSSSSHARFDEATEIRA
jgi:hypothetical protein